MRIKKKCIAMLLAGGQGSRLGVLTAQRAKPAVAYGGKYKIIDFPLSNCVNSGIDTVGVLTQYQPLELNAYIGTGAPWDLDVLNGGAYILPPYVRGKKGEWYSGTANAIYQNIDFIEQYSPDYIIVLSGDHIYKMNYNRMVDFHVDKGADATIAVMRVPIEEASRFGIMNTNEDMSIYEFEEKPPQPKSDMASMGVYVFSWEVVKRYLLADAEDPNSSNDFGKNIIPAMLNGGEKMFAYPFEGYWKDVGTVESLWEANMELLHSDPELDLHDPAWRIYSRNRNKMPHYVGDNATVQKSIVAEGCYIYGTVDNSVLFPGVTVEQGAVVKDSIIMEETHIGAGAVVDHAIVDDNCKIGAGAKIGASKKITVIGAGVTVSSGAKVAEGDAIAPGKEV